MIGSPFDKLYQWRDVFAAWHVGFSAVRRGRAEALRYLHHELMMIRCELSAATYLLVDADYFQQDEFQARRTIEMSRMNDQLEDQFPGFKATANGLDINAWTAEKTKKRLEFPPDNIIPPYVNGSARPCVPSEIKTANPTAYTVAQAWTAARGAAPNAPDALLSVAVSLLVNSGVSADALLCVGDAFVEAANLETAAGYPLAADQLRKLANLLRDHTASRAERKG